MMRNRFCGFYSFQYVGPGGGFICTIIEIVRNTSPGPQLLYDRRILHASYRGGRPPLERRRPADVSETEI